MEIVKVKKGAFLHWLLIFETKEEQKTFGDDLRDLDELHGVFKHDTAYERGCIELSKQIL